MNAIEWLNSPSGVVRGPDRLPFMAEQPTRLEIIADLVLRNGGKSIVETISLNPMGLNIYEAFTLVKMWSYMEGLCSNDTDVFRQAMFTVIQNEVKRLDNGYGNQCKVEIASENDLKSLQRVKRR